MPADLLVTLTVPAAADGGELHYVAPAPADHRHSFAGSGLPFPSARAAMDRTPNRGTLVAAPGSAVTVALHYPNAYRAPCGAVVPPAVHLEWREGGRLRRLTRTLGPRVPHRALTHHPARCPLKAAFYAGTHALEVRGQEAVLRAGAYPDAHGGGRARGAAASAALEWGGRPRL